MKIITIQHYRTDNDTSGNPRQLVEINEYNTNDFYQFSNDRKYKGASCSKSTIIQFSYLDINQVINHYIKENKYRNPFIINNGMVRISVKNYNDSLKHDDPIRM